MRRGAERDLRAVTYTDAILMAVLEELVDLRQFLEATLGGDRPRDLPEADVPPEPEPVVDPPVEEPPKKRKRKAKARG